MTEWKMHTMENDRIVTPWKMEENSSIENARMENTHLGKWQKNHTLENARNSSLQNDKMENAHLGKWQKILTLENVRKITTGK